MRTVNARRSDLDRWSGSGQIVRFLDGDFAVVAPDSIDSDYWCVRQCPVLSSNEHGIMFVPAWLELTFRGDTGVDTTDEQITSICHLMRDGVVSAEAFEAAYRLGGWRSVIALAEAHRK